MEQEKKETIIYDEAFSIPEELVAIDPNKLRESLSENKPQEQQRYEFRDCKTCGTETRFVSTVSPKGYWVCCRCGTRVSAKPFNVDFGSGDYRFSK